METAIDEQDQPGAIRSVSIVGASLALWALGSYTYYLIAGRVVGPATYGLVSALIGVLSIVGWPCIALQWSTARTLASASSRDRASGAAVYRRAMLFAWAWALGLALSGIVAVLAFAAVNEHVPVWPLIATCGSIVPLIPLYVSIGALQGESRYSAYGVTWALTGVLRAPLMLPFLLLPSAGAGAAILGTGLAALVGVLAAMWLTRDDLLTAGPPSRDLWDGFRRSLPASVIGLLGFAGLFSMGVVVAKLRLPAEEAGLFGAAGVLSRAILMVPQALTIILLPRVARRRRADVPTGALLAAGVATTLAVGALGVGLVAVAGDPIMTITFGSKYTAAASLLPQFLAASTIIGALFILVNHHVARSDHRYAWALGAIAVVHLGLLIAVGTSANLIIAVDGCVAVLGIVVHEVLYRGTGDSLIAGTRAFAAGGRARLSPGRQS